jgi:hypothetical protein
VFIYNRFISIATSLILLFVELENFSKSGVRVPFDLLNNTEEVEIKLAIEINKRS